MREYLIENLPYLHVNTETINTEDTEDFRFFFFFKKQNLHMSYMNIRRIALTHIS